MPIYCGDRFCAVCGAGRRARVRARIEFLIANTTPAANEGYKHLTLTVKNQPDLAPMLKHLAASFRRLRSHALWKQSVKGGAFVIEVTGTSGSWHGHLHIVMVSRFIAWTALRNLWQKVSGGIGVWIDEIPPNKASRYLTKYLTKPSVAPDELFVVNNSLYKFRLFQPFGDWHALNVKYEKPPHPCAKCGSTHWLPLAYLYSSLSEASEVVSYHSPPNSKMKADAVSDYRRGLTAIAAARQSSLV